VGERQGDEIVITKLTQQHARPIVLGTALLLLVDLFFHWHKAPVHTVWRDDAGATSALEGWGAVVGVFLVAFLLVEFITSRRGRVVAAGVAVAAASLTFVEFFTGSASATKIDGIAAASTEQTLWPAYAGLALAVLLVLAAVNRLFAKPEARLPLPPLVRRRAAFGSAA
jgi:hypothetical protein